MIIGTEYCFIAVFNAGATCLPFFYISNITNANELAFILHRTCYIPSASVRYVLLVNLLSDRDAMKNFSTSTYLTSQLFRGRGQSHCVVAPLTPGLKGTQYTI